MANYNSSHTGAAIDTAVTVAGGSSGLTDKSVLIGSGTAAITPVALGANEFLVGSSGADPVATTNLTFDGTTLAVTTGNAGSVTEVTAGDELVLEGSGHTGLSILAPTASARTIYFGNPASSTQGYIQHTGSDELQLATNSIVRMSIASDGKFTMGSGLQFKEVARLSNVQTAHQGWETIASVGSSEEGFWVLYGFGADGDQHYFAFFSSSNAGATRTSENVNSNNATIQWDGSNNMQFRQDTGGARRSYVVLYQLEREA